MKGRLHVIHVLDNAPMNWQGYSGLLNPEMLKKLFERIPDWGIEKTTYLMCGPGGDDEKMLIQFLKQHKIPKEKVFKESFVQGIIDKKESPAETASLPVMNLKPREVTIAVRWPGI
jgi:ring-1,2-phenylacetyl-CoA epoxidase subunit PaaE